MFYNESSKWIVFLSILSYTVHVLNWLHIHKKDFSVHILLSSVMCLPSQLYIWNILKSLKMHRENFQSDREIWKYNSSGGPLSTTSNCKHHRDDMHGVKVIIKSLNDSSWNFFFVQVWYATTRWSANRNRVNATVNIWPSRPLDPR